MRRLLQSFVRDITGATAIEYAVIGGLISIALIGSLSLVANGVTNTWSTVAKTVDEQMK